MALLATDAAQCARGKRQGVGAQSDRCVHPQPAREEGAGAESRGRQARATAARDIRSHRLAADAERAGRFPGRSIAAGIRNGRRAAARFAGSYGEHWAQHWLDVVRYAESDGFKEDAHRPNAYKYRDYVIRAINSDMPYDRFVRQQLAGDELEPDNPDAIVATGYCRLYPDEFNAADVRQRRQEILDDVTDTTGLAFLGLTIGCAQCHNHKFDDILQTDYYRLQSFFTPMLPRDDLPEATRSERDKFAKKQAAWEKATADIRAEIESLSRRFARRLSTGRSKSSTPKLSRRFTLPRNRPVRTALQKQIAFQAMKYINPRLQGVVDELKGEQEELRYEDLRLKLAKFDSIKPRPLPAVRGVTDADNKSPPTFRLSGGSLKHPAEQVEPGFPEFLGASTAEIVLRPRPRQYHRPAHGFGQLALTQRQSDDGTRHGQSPVAISFRPRHRRHAERFRSRRRIADASGIA